MGTGNRILYDSALEFFPLDLPFPLPLPLALPLPLPWAWASFSPFPFGFAVPCPAARFEAEGLLTDFHPNRGDGRSDRLFGA